MRKTYRMSIHISLKDPKKTSRNLKVLIIGGKWHELPNERKRKRDRSWNEEKKLWKKMKMLKADIKGKFPTDAPWLSENGPYMQFSSSLKTVPVYHPEKVNLSRITTFFAPLAGHLFVILARLLDAKLTKKITFYKIDQFSQTCNSKATCIYHDVVGHYTCRPENRSKPSIFLVDCFFGKKEFEKFGVANSC